MYGAIIGDIIGSVYEFNNHRSKDFDLFTSKMFFTDDTVMTLAVAKALLDYDRISDVNAFKKTLVGYMHELGNEYICAGYGGRFLSWIMRRLTEPYNSYGNGTAMRVSACVWYADSLDEAMDIAEATAAVTHNHPEGIKGARVTAGAAFLARSGADKDEIRKFVEQYYALDFTIDEIRPTYRFNETCQQTVPQAMEAFLESESFEDCVRTAISVGGDSDTLAAIACTVAEAYYGVPFTMKIYATSYLDSDLTAILDAFEEKYPIGKENENG
jgi:type I restriction enzyme M protein